MRWSFRQRARDRRAQRIRRGNLREKSKNCSQPAMYSELLSGARVSGEYSHSNTSAAQDYKSSASSNHISLLHFEQPSFGTQSTLFYLRTLSALATNSTRPGFKSIWHAERAKGLQNELPFQSRVVSKLLCRVGSFPRAPQAFRESLQASVDHHNSHHLP